MHASAQRFGAVLFSLALAIPSAAWSAPVSSPAAASAPAVPPTAPKAGDTVTVDALLDYYAEHFDIIFAKTGKLDKEVTLKRDIPTNVDAAISQLDDILETQSLATWRVRRTTEPGEAASGRIVLQVLTLQEVKVKKRDESPVTTGIDPAAIDISERDRIITHMVPISNKELVDTVRRAAQEEKDVAATVIGSDQAGYQLVLTGPALNVRRALIDVITIDKPAEKIVPVVRNMHLDNIDAADSAVSINQLYGPNVLGDKAVRAVADARTNTIILTGPEAQVLRVMGDLTVQDKGPLPTVPRGPGGLGGSGSNRRGGRLPDSLLPPMASPQWIANAQEQRILRNIVQNRDSDAISVHPASVSDEIAAWARGPGWLA